MIIRVLRNNGVIQRMDMEEYVKGVVPSEMPASWAAEALKAQAVAARTYALWQISIAPAGRTWDIGCTTSYQVYTDYRDARATAAVEATSGVTGGTKDTALIKPTYFSSSCGGHTLNTWGPSWLKSTACPCNRAVFGHRNGLCQYGSKFLAERGYTCYQILDFYYNLTWWNDYLLLGPVAYNPHPTNPWPNGTPLPEPPPEPEPQPEVPPYEIGGGKFWDELAGVFLWVAVKVALLADSIKGVPLLGKWFFHPLDDLAMQIDDLHIYILEFTPQYQAVLDFIADVIDGTLLNTLLSSLFVGWDDLRFDPGGWVIDQVKRVWPELADLLLFPGDTIEGWLTGRWDWLSTLLRSPSDWVMQQVYQVWPDGYWLITDPGYMIDFWIRQAYPGAGTLLADPRGWLKERVAALFGAREDLFDSPGEWALYWIKGAIEKRPKVYRDYLQPLLEHFVRYLWEGVWE